MTRTLESERNPVRTRARSGFTLIEMLISMVLLAVIGSMAMPSIYRSMTNSRVDRAAQTVANDVEAAFSLAARERKPMILVVDTLRKRILIIDRVTSDTLQQRSFSLTESEFGLTRLVPNPTSITVFPNGLASANFVIYAWANTARRVINVKRTGQIRVEMP